MAIQVEKLTPNTISDTGIIDGDSGLRMFRGMITPWERIKSFRETCHFLWRHSALFGVAYMNALKIVEPDYEKRQSTMSTNWAMQMQYLWSQEDPMGIVKGFEERHDVPPFMKESLYRSACYCDIGDEFTGMPGYVWYASDDRISKEIHQCPIDIIGPDACDLSVGGGQYFCFGCSGKGKDGMNVYLMERKGCGDPYCHTLHESVAKYGKHKNADGYDWEHWGPAATEIRKEGQPHKLECEWMHTGEFVSPLGARWTAGEMYKQACQAPLAYAGHAAGAIRALTAPENAEMSQHIVNVMFETAGKFQFGEYNTRKAAREWLGVPAEINDGRVLGAYISMIQQARSVPWSFIDFSEERTVVEVDAFMQNYFGQFPEFTEAYRAYFDAMAKTLVDTQWVVKLGEDAPEGKIRYVIEKGVYGFRRQKPDYKHPASENKNDAMLLSTDPIIREQHLAVRNNVGWYDFTHRLVEVKGPDALALLDKLCIAPIYKASIGGSKYTAMLNHDGLIIDDTIVTHMGEDLYWVSGLYVRDQLNWFKANKGDLNVEFRDITAGWKMYSIQGPNSLALVNAVVDVPVDELKFFRMQDNTMDGIPVKVHRAGYTGEKRGYEIYIATDKEAKLVEKLEIKGAELNACHVTKLDVMVFTLAAEAGYVLMMDIYKTNPYESGFEKSIDWSKDFIGKEAVAKVRDEGPKRKLVGFTVADDSALIYGGPLSKGDVVQKAGKMVGRVTKYTTGFTCGKNIGYALIDIDKASIGDTVTINGYEAVLTEKHFI